MSVIKYTSATKILVSVKGHPYQRDEFFAMFEDMQDLSYTAVEQPASKLFFAPETAADYDAHVLYDMPGIDFSCQPPRLVDPGQEFKRNFIDLLNTGHGFVFLHHAIAGWPTWPEYAEIVGGKFLYLPAELRGASCLDSGYRHDASYTASINNNHAVTAGIDLTFPLTDELYLYEVFEDDVIPLISSDYSFDREHFYSARQAVTGNMHCRDDWPHQSGSKLIGWVKHYLNSPVVYLQMGDGPSAYGASQYRQLLENAIRWVSSADAHQWARERNSRPPVKRSSSNQYPNPSI